VASAAADGVAIWTIIVIIIGSLLAVAIVVVVIVVGIPFCRSRGINKRISHENINMQTLQS
jgi:hypothetical protein